MILASINDLPPTDEQAVIINVGTKLVSSLALLSALRYAEMKVLVIDCESKDGSVGHFTDLMKTHRFDLLSAPLKKHGYTLDWLFKVIPARKVLLIDSDAEILSEEIVKMMKKFIDDPLVFGTGFIHGPGWLDERHDAGFQVGYYQERMWIPLTFLRVDLVRKALADGFSFIDRTAFNDFAVSSFISRILKQRFRLSWLKNSRLSWLNPLKENFYGVKPSYVYYDTGADIFQYLKYRKHYDFVGFPARLHEDYAAHYHGVTRLTLDASDKNGTQLGNVLSQIRQRLRDNYGVENLPL